MTLLNIHESKRFKKGAFRFWGCLPVYQAEAATNAVACMDQVRKRTVEVHQAGLHVVFEAIQELCAATPFRFADNKVHNIDSISQNAVWHFLWETSLLMTSMLPRKASHAECVERRTISWPTLTRFGF